MKLFLPFFLLFFYTFTVAAQDLYLKLESSSQIENTVIDSIGYIRKHSNLKSIIAESTLFSNKLSKLGYLENEISQSSKPNDSTYLYEIKVSKRTDLIYIKVDDLYNDQMGEKYVQNTTVISIPLSSVDEFISSTLSRLEKKGYAFATVQLINLQKVKNNLTANLEIILNRRRQLNDIVINGYSKFPEGHRNNIKRLYRNKIFNQENLQKIYKDFEKFRFVKQTRYPEILFEKDSTKIYVYLEKAKANTFDGFVGFGNNDQKKITFNGYLDLALNNVLNSGEKFILYWKSDGNAQKTFNASIELPYLFKSPFGLKAQLNIFKKDSTFQNTRTSADLGYYFNYNTRLYLGYQSTESSDIQNLNSISISDYKNSFITTNFEYLILKSEDPLFPVKTILNIKAGIGDRSAKDLTDSQIFVGIDYSNTFYFNRKNSFQLRSQNYVLKSKSYIVNELYRFGGINSIRGFNENSLQGNFFTSAITEYRYLISPGIYAHTILDYALKNDKTSDRKDNLTGFGFGFGLLTKTGLINIIYANGSTKNQAIKLSNSIIHISFKTTF